ncbi:MAG TPA: hypothetical protein VFT84_08910 [Gemmatimonadales bacterium]|nr:hypothetical protein [Gemmatimonadales bacterium]
MTRTHGLIGGKWSHAAGVVLSLLAARTLSAQTGAEYTDYTPPPGGVVTTSAGEQYAAGPLHRAFLGEHYRDLWAAPIEVPVLDLATYAGGLEPAETGGGQQTRSLKFKDDDGREYTFRGVDKDPTRALPSAYRGTVVNRLARDATSAGHPAAPLIASSLLDAVGVLHAKPQLFVMPDDERLGRFQAEFGGMLGYMEQRPDDGFAGADEVVEWDELVELLQERPSHRVDARELLKARLVDHLLGDWDRHRDQWRWAGYRRGGRTVWRPIPRDRDQALVRYDGFLLGLARRIHPKLLNFGPRYPGVLGLAWNAQELDRRLLSSLDGEAFDAVAAEVQAAVTDSVIAASVRRTPASYQAERGEWLTDALRQRRDSLRVHAAEFYRFLAEDVDVTATDAAESAEARRLPDGRLSLVITTAEGGDTTFRRTFDPRETAAVRLRLLGAPDSLRIEGDGGRGPLLEVEREPGVDAIVTAPGAGRYRLYDPRPATERVKSDSTASDQPPRDWGSSFGISPRAEYEADLGLVLGLQAARTDYAFHRSPYGSRIRLVAQYATAADGLRADLVADVRRVNPDVRFELRVRASEIEMVRFTGFGNETPQPDGDFQNVDQWQLTVAPVLAYAAGERVRLEVGPVLRYTTTDLEGAHLIDRLRPLGATGFGRVGLQTGVALAGLDSLELGQAGAGVTLGGSLYPPVWSADAAFGEMHVEAVGRLPIRVGPVPLLALRAGGKRVWGAFPYDEAALLGGQGSLRGFDYQRFAGKASLYGSVELRVPVARVLEDWVPTQIGVFALGDAGRVWADGSGSSLVHAAGGGGIWLSLFEDRNTVSLAAASGGEGTRWYLRSGLAF